MNPPSDSLFGQYRLLRLLGRGGMGEVYEVEHTTLGKNYALKLLPPEFATRPEAVARFRREAKVMANLNHPHIVRVDDFGETDGRYWLRMELVRGVEPRRDRSADIPFGSMADADKNVRAPERCVTLGDYAAAKGGRLDQAEFAPVLKQVLEALAHAHAAGVVHRDLKPGNILLEQDETARMVAKVADFGLARVVGDEFLRSQRESSLSRNVSLGEAKTLGEAGDSTRAFVGTWEYMSPEQRQGREADARSDVYAVGLICYRLLTGKVLGPRLPSELIPGLKPEWDRFISGALEHDREARYADGAAMLAAAAPLLGNLKKPPMRVAIKLESVQTPRDDLTAAPDQRPAAEAPETRPSQAHTTQLGLGLADRLQLLPWGWVVLGLAVLAVPLMILKPGTFPWLPLVLVAGGIAAWQLALGTKWPALTAIALGLVVGGVGGYLKHVRAPGSRVAHSTVPAGSKTTPSLGSNSQSDIKLQRTSRWSSGLNSRHYRRYGAEVMTLAAVPGGRFIAVATTGDIELWDAGLRSVLRTLPDARLASASSISLGSGTQRSKWLSCSRDGRLLACASDSLAASSALLFDLQTGEMLRTFTPQEKGSATKALALSPDGQVLACGYTIGYGRASQVTLWNAATGDLSKRLALVPKVSSRGLVPSTLDEQVTVLAFAPDGQTLACGYKVSGGRGVVRIWDVNAGNVIRQCAPALNAGNREEWVVSLAYSPDGLTLASGYSNTGGNPGFGEVRLWNLQAPSGAPQTVLRSPPTQPGLEILPEVLAFSPSGRHLACSFTRPLAPWEIRVWDLEANAALAPISDAAGGLTGSSSRSVSGMCFTPDGQTLLCGFTGSSLGQEMMLFEIREVGTGRLLRQVASNLPDEAAGVRALAVSHDEATVACGFAGPASRGEMALVADGHGKTPRVIPESSTHPTNFNHLRFLSAATFLPGDQKVVCAYAGPDSDGSLSIWDAQTGELARTLKLPATTPPGAGRSPVVAMAVAPDSRTLLCACMSEVGEFEARLWDLEDGTLRYRTELETQPLGALGVAAFDAAGQPLVGSYHGTDNAAQLVLLNPKTGAVLRLLQTLPGEYPAGFKPTAASLSPDGKRLAGAHSKGGASAYESPLVLWDVGGEVLRLVAQDKNSFGGGVITAVGFCNNGQNLVCGTSEGSLQHWEQKAPTTGAPRSSKP